MNVVLQTIRKVADTCCIRLYVVMQLYTALLLFLLGIALLSAGTIGLAKAQITPPESSPNFLPEASINFAPEAAIPVAPEDTSASGYDDTLFRLGTGNLLAFIEGPFGALIMVAAGIGAIIAAAVGGFKVAWALFMVAVGAFILRSLVSLFFGTDYPVYGVDGIFTVGPGAAGPPVGALPIP